MSIAYKDHRDEAVQAAYLFLRRVRELEDDMRTPGYPGPKQSGAVRRASMELTRALAELRKYS